MRAAIFAAVMLIAFCCTWAGGSQQTDKPSEAATAGPPPHITYLDKSKVIYVMNFGADLETETAAAPNDGPIDPRTMGSPQLNGTDNVGRNTTSPGAGKALADDLLRDLKKAGYKTKPLGAHDSMPEEGILLSGVFTQIGKSLEMRRVTVGSEQLSGDVQIYLTTANLLRTQKPLYETVSKSSARNSASEVIRLNPEVATLKFVMTAHPDAKAIKKTAEQIVAELERLTLQAESQGLADSEDPINKYSKP